MTKTITKKSNIPAIEILGETCAKAQKRQKLVYSPDGKSRWYEDIKEET